MARPGPAPSSPALSSPGYGARRSHDLWGRGCRSEGAGEPGRSGNKGRGCEAGVAAASRPGGHPPPHLCRSRPAGSGKGRKEATGTRAPHPLPGLHLSPGVCGGGEPDQQHPPTHPFPAPRRSASLRPRPPRRTWGCPRAVGNPGPSPERSSPCQARAGQRADM